MRIIKELSLEGCRITFFAWNNRYLIKLEQGILEQTFKVDQSDLENEAQLISLLDAEFIQQAVKRFLDMGQSIYEAKLRNGL